MAQGFKSTNIFLTLPISCQICLEKVRHPVICPNNHVFCSKCMETWLKKTSVCPSCRVPITAENPCKVIIGGTTESNSTDDRSMRKDLRKTRGERLLQEYEEEIEDLMTENEMLRIANQGLDDELKRAVTSCSNSAEEQENNSHSASELQDLWNNMTAATEACVSFKEDADKLTEANRVLRSQNVDLQKENVRLKEILQVRSPPMYSPYGLSTSVVSRLEETERDMNIMRRALQHNNQYIEKLENQLRRSQEGCAEVREAGGKSKAGPEGLTQQQKINMMMRSLSDNERELICSNPEAECSFSRTVSLSSRPSSDGAEFLANVAKDQCMADSTTPQCDFLPTTPSTAFRSLTLKSPGFPEKKAASKSLPHQRKLNFNLSPEKEPRVNISIPYMHSPTFGKGPLSDFMELSKSSFWSSLQKPDLNLPNPGPCHQSSSKTSASSHVKEEAAINASYQDKVAELDFMILEEGSSSTRSSLTTTSSHGAVTLESPTDSCPTAVWEPLKQFMPKISPNGENTDATCNAEEAPEAPDAADASGKQDGVVVPGCSDPTSPSRFNITFMDVPFDVDKVVAGTSGFLCCTDQDHATSSCSSCTTVEPANAEEKKEMSGGQMAKRKSHSPFSKRSTSKHSKLM